MNDIFWSVDSLVIKNNALFGHGWIFHTKYQINNISVRLNFVEGDDYSTEHIPVDTGKVRDDVRQKFTNQPHAYNSGYVVYGAFQPGLQITSIDLVCSLSDGSFLALSVPSSCVLQLDSSDQAKINKYKIRMFYVFFKRGMHLVFTSRFTVLFERARIFFTRQRKIYLSTPEKVIAALRKSERKNICFIVDHDLGGGAALYREQLVDSIIKDHKSVIIFTYDVSTLTHKLIVVNSRVKRVYLIPDEKFIINLIKYLSVSEIIYNDAVSFIRPEEIPLLLINLKEATSAHLRVLIHDFFPVCPSHFLIDHEGKHCHIPDTRVCSNCLPRNHQGFISLFHKRNISAWRTEWGALLSSADEIVTFSNNSSSLLLKAYPQIEKSRISVIPHKLDHMPHYIPKIMNTDTLCIGIVGHISRHKGSLFINSLEQEIKRRGIDVKIVVIGVIEVECDPDVVTQTGPYKHDQLAGLIEKSGANVFLFPSIGPETFSYVVEELMFMSLPIASFNLGAPAERLATYRKGLILDSMISNTVLDQLISFHLNIYPAN